MAKHNNVLFRCIGNSARSIMAEAILNFKGRPNFTAISDGLLPVQRAARALSTDLKWLGSRSSLVLMNVVELGPAADWFCLRRFRKDASPEK